MTLTFDLYSDLALISSCDVAGYTHVGSLILYLCAFDLQSPVTKRPKTISFNSPLSIFGPV